ncbi:hypothetical protein EOD39_6990, partial [Acipenser ruthenus]
PENIENLTHAPLFCSRFGNQIWYCYVFFSLYTFALPVGILGNIAALLHYICCKKSWTSSNIFLFNLALCDFAWLLTIPFSIYFNLQQPSVYNDQTFCQFQKIFFNINIYGSISFLTLISFDRYAGTVHPISSIKWWNTRKAKICSLTVWMILFLESIPDFFFTFAVKRLDNSTVCLDPMYGPFTYVKTLSILRTLLGFLIPFIIMFTCYILTVRVLRKRSLRRRSDKPLRLISAAMVVFAVSFIPYHIMIMTLIILRIKNSINQSNFTVLFATYEFFKAICCISSCLDPILYMLASDNFQKNCKELKSHPERICCHRRTRRVGDLTAACN